MYTENATNPELHNVYIPNEKYGIPGHSYLNYPKTTKTIEHSPKDIFYRLPPPPSPPWANEVQCLMGSFPIYSHTSKP